MRYIYIIYIELKTLFFIPPANNYIPESMHYIYCEWWEIVLSHNAGTPGDRRSSQGTCRRRYGSAGAITVARNSASTSGNAREPITAQKRGRSYLLRCTFHMHTRTHTITWYIGIVTTKHSSHLPLKLPNNSDVIIFGAYLQIHKHTCQPTPYNKCMHIRHSRQHFSSMFAYAC